MSRENSSVMHDIGRGRTVHACLNVDQLWVTLTRSVFYISWLLNSTDNTYKHIRSPHASCTTTPHISHGLPPPCCSLSRYLSQKEVDEKKARNIAKGEGSKHVSPIMSQSLNRAQMERLIARKDTLAYHCFEMFTGMPVTLAEEGYPVNMLHLDGGLFVNMEGGKCVHVRKYWKNAAGAMIPDGSGQYLTYYL